MELSLNGVFTCQFKLLRLYLSFICIIFPNSDAADGYVNLYPFENERIKHNEIKAKKIGVIPIHSDATDVSFCINADIFFECLKQIFIESFGLITLSLFFYLLFSCFFGGNSSYYQQI
jgi:hypothetical protein